jgi:hypothetical protein
LTHLATLWQRANGPWRERIFLAAFLTATLASAHLAREGTLLARAGTAAIFLALAVAWGLSAWWSRRSELEPARLAKKLGSFRERSLGERAQRAVRLVGSSDATGDALAAGLARVHLERLLANVRPEDIWEAGRRRASLGRKTVLGLLFVAVVALALGPLRVIEGLNVLVAWRGRAPLSIDWVDALLCNLQPPAYLSQRSHSFLGFVPTYQPVGTTVTVHAYPRFEGRPLVLTDGSREVPFAEDGRGGVMATWTVDQDVRLQVAARFGDVLILQSDELSIEALRDEVPQVNVEDAPRTVRLLDVQEVPIRYEAVDDHGLTQVDLVLRAGGRESRRVLAKHDGSMPFDRGSAVLRRDDRFLHGAHVPVEVTVEARDNDPVGGPKWGRSKPILLLPPAVGEEEAMRFEALVALRNQLLDLLAARLSLVVPESPIERTAMMAKQQEAQKVFGRSVLDAAGATYGGIEMSRRLRSFLSGQLERMDKATVGVCGPEAPAKTCEKQMQRLGDLTGDAVLALDVASRSLSTRDSVLVAKKLSDVAEEGAEGARLIRQTESDRGRTRLEAALTVLRGGAGSLSRLGGLGSDLGEVVGMGVRRIERCMTRDDTHCAELAATDLAARLRRPHPSFSGGGGRQSTEAGGTPGFDDSAAGESAMEAFESRGDEIGELAREHADRIDEVRRAMSEAMNAVDMDSLRDAAREHARYVRDAVRGLPTRAADMSSLEGAAMVMREQAERMADALDRTALSDADQAAQNALKAADQARRIADQERDLFGQPLSLGRDVERARSDLEREQRWVREQLDRMRRAASDQARDSLREAAGSEKRLAERAKRIAEGDQAGENPLPRSTMQLLKQAADAMREAAKAMEGADGDQAMARQREAQRLLEMASESLNEPSRPSSPAAKEDGQNKATEKQSETDGEGKELATGRVDIPSADAFTGPEAFRRRVVEGLSEPADPALREAVRRYAEGLLR